MLALQRERATAVVEVEAGDVRTFVYFRGGRAIFAEEGTLGETLGRLLVEQGLLTAEQYSRVIERMTAHLIESEQLRFGEVVVELGLLTIDQVQAALADQVQRKIARCFAWESATLDVRHDAELLAGAAQFPCTIEPLVLEAVRRFFDARRIEATLAPALDAYVALAEDAAGVGERFKLSGPELRVVEALDGTRTLRDLLARGGPIDPAPLAAALLTAGVVEVLRAPRPRSAVQPPPPVTRPAAPAARERPAAPSPKVSAASPRTPAPLGGARRSSRPPDVQRARLEAEQAFQRGKAALAAHHVARAVTELRQATKLYPDAAEYQLHLAWAEFRALEDPDQIVRQRPVLKAIALSALQKDRGLAIAHFIAGQVALLDDDTVAAERFFKIAFKLDPSNRDAERHVRLLARRAQTR